MMFHSVWVEKVGNINTGIQTLEQKHCLADSWPADCWVPGMIAVPGGDITKISRDDPKSMHMQLTLLRHRVIYFILISFAIPYPHPSIFAKL